MSASANRPPGRSTRAASENTRRLSATSLMTPLEMTASNESILERQLLDQPATERHSLSAIERSALASCSGVMSTPVTEPVGPTCSRGREYVHAGAAAEIENALSREQPSQPEVVTDARERVDGPVGQPVEQIGGIAERLRRAGARWGSADRSAVSFATSRYMAAIRGRAPRDPRSRARDMWCLFACRQLHRRAFLKRS